MKIVHLSTFATGNGAAVAGHRLHGALRRLDHDSVMFVAKKGGEIDDPNIVVFKPPRDIVKRVFRRLRSIHISRSLSRYGGSRPKGYEFFSDDRSAHGADVLDQLPSGDIINIHSMFYFADFRTFFSTVPRRTPVVRTLHDMIFFTGGCHLDGGCGKYKDRCGACPQLGSRNTNDLSRRIWQRKYSALSTVDPRCLHVVTPSRWLADEARRSTVLKQFPITVIPNGIDTDDFSPRDRRVARDVLKISQDASVVLFVAEPISRPNKGFSVLADALTRLGDVNNPVLISVGSGKPPVEVPIPHLHLGYLGYSRLLSLVYSAADVFVIPSSQENFPQTGLESSACGTPVVGFAGGGVSEIVQHGVTGLLVPPQDVAALGSAIRTVVQDPLRRQEMAGNCRDMAVKEYSLDVQARRYVKLYESILAEREIKQPVSHETRDEAALCS